VDRQHDAHLGTGDLGQARDLALGVHAHLEDAGLVRRLEVEERHRQAGLAVEVALVAQHGHHRRPPAGAPGGVDGVSMKSSSDVIVKAAVSQRAQRVDSHSSRLAVAGP